MLIAQNKLSRAVVCTAEPVHEPDRGGVRGRGEDNQSDDSEHAEQSRT